MIAVRDAERRGQRRSVSSMLTLADSHERRSARPTRSRWRPLWNRIGRFVDDATDNDRSLDDERRDMERKHRDAAFDVDARGDQPREMVRRRVRGMIVVVAIVIARVMMIVLVMRMRVTVAGNLIVRLQCQMHRHPKDSQREQDREERDRGRLRTG
jgi:hypothetical protein